MKTRIFFWFLGISFLFGKLTYGQSVQDCIGAIPVCQSTYYQANSYTGSGNIVDYTGYGSCAMGMCVDPEANSVWYTFQVQTAGLLDFRITPNVANSDYDWVLFDLTNFSCSDLQNVSLYPQIVASCNAANTYGVTGANSLTPNTNINCQDPSALNAAPANNAPINTYVGQRFYLNIQNWTGSTVGFTLDFTNSTASIFDNIPPVLVAVDTTVGCNDSSITVTFSENVLCNTVDATDFTFVGPDGPHTVTGVTGQACLAGGNQEYVYSVKFTPPIVMGGVYSLSLVGPVTDLCGNVASNANFDFNVMQVACAITNVTQPLCGASNGSIEVVASQGSGNYAYTWNTVPVQSTSIASGLTAGAYSVTVNDGYCSSICDTVLVTTGGLSDSVSYVNASCGFNNGSATVWASGFSPFTYNWDTNPVQTTQTISGLAAGTYNVTVTDAANCTAVNQVIINPSAALVFTSTKVNETCLGACNGEINITVSSGVPPYTFTWT
ncbi:MAG: SprB repeat-containing protein, partial [Bacteroidota bacterium]